jgi:branched-subunit amino acid ABC-type transport system permease component
VTLLATYVVLGIAVGSIYGLAAVGLVLTYRTSGLFNFAHGTVAAVGAYTFYVLRQQHGVPWPIALVVAVAVAGPIMGILLELMGRRLANASIVSRVVATVGILIGLLQIAILIFGAPTRAFDPFLPTGTFTIGSIRVGWNQLIVVLVALVATIGLTLLLKVTRLGAAMRGVVDNDGLVALTGMSPTSIRRRAWMIGCAFASLSGVLIAPTIGLDANLLTLLVVNAFGAAAVGLFTSLPLTYVGGLVIGIGGAFAQRWAQSFHVLSGLKSSLPFILLFIVLVVAPRRRLIDIAPERRRAVMVRPSASPQVKLALGVAGIALLLLIPTMVGPRLIGYSAGLAYAIVFLSLLLLDRYSGQLSLAQLSFSAVGGASFSHFSAGFHIPWLIAVLLGALVAVPVGALLAIPAIRLSGLYLALASFGFGLLMQYLFYGQRYMFGFSGSSVSTPRPSMFAGDRSYYYLLVVFVVLSCALLIGIRRSPLGRLLRAMADSPTALATGGMSVTTLRVFVFCVSAFLAGLGGALLGPVTGQLAPLSLDTFSSLTLVVILALQAFLPDIPAVFAAAFASQVLPSYFVTHQTAHNFLPALFGISAVLVAVSQGGHRDKARTSTTGRARWDDRLRRSPVRARMVQRAHAADAPLGDPQLEPVA